LFRIQKLLTFDNQERSPRLDEGTRAFVREANAALRGEKQTRCAMDRIKRVSILFKWLFMAALVGLPVLNALLWLLVDRADLAGAVNVGGINLAEIPISDPLAWDARLLALGASLLPLAANMVALFNLVRLFGLYAAGEIFSVRNVRCIRFLGYAIIARQAVDPLFQALLSAALTLHNPEGQRVISVGLSDTNVTELVIGFVILLVSWVMDEGRRLKDEEALVI
jgi:hypothetical protein